MNKAKYVFEKLSGFKLPKEMYSKLVTDLNGMKVLRDKFGGTLSAAVNAEKNYRALNIMPNKSSKDIVEVMRAKNRVNNKIKQMFKEQNLLN
jgi:hypothetical protein